MRTTKYDWICLLRTALVGGYDPRTGETNPVITLRQELWVKAFFRPDKTGNEFVPVTLGDGSSAFDIYGESNFGTLFIREIPKWPDMINPYINKPIYPPNAYAWWSVTRPQFDANAPTTNFNWVKIQAVSNTTIGTRFSKHYEAKLASLNPEDVIDEGPPESSAPTTLSFEQAEARLRTVIKIGDGIVN